VIIGIGKLGEFLGRNVFHPQASFAPSGEKLPELPQSVSIGDSMPPSTGTSNIVTTFGKTPLSRDDVKTTFLPSGVQPMTLSSAE
jgi:hypothetical protein